jgi:hypothetical protein
MMICANVMYYTSQTFLHITILQMRHRLMQSMTFLHVTNVVNMAANVDIDMTTDIDIKVYDNVAIMTHLFMG